MSTTFRSREFDTPESPLDLCCPHCEADPVIHQPDERLYNRLLATCSECTSWFLRDVRGNLKELPSVEDEP